MLFLLATVVTAGGPVSLKVVKPPTATVPGKHLILVVDVSGSMAEHYGKAIALAAQFAETASDDYQLHCVTFGSAPAVWPGGWADMPDLEKLKALRGWLALQQVADSGHGTFAKPAIERAEVLAKGKEAYVIVITDGILNDEPKPTIPTALLQVGEITGERFREAMDKFSGHCKLGWYVPE